MKSFKKFFSILFVCVLLSLTVCSDYISCYNVKASGGISDYIDNLTNYFLTITGAINKPSSHSTTDHIDISPVPSTSRNAIKQKISDLINNNGIYESNGQYIFTSSAMDELYYILNGNSYSNFRVINDYSSFDYQINNDIGVYFDSTVLSNIQSVITSAQSTGNPYLLCACGYKTSYKPYNNVVDYVNYSFYAIILNDNVSFIDYTNTGNYNRFKNSSDQVLNLSGYQTSFTYEGGKSNPYSYNNPTSYNYYNSLPTGLIVNATGNNYIANNFPIVLHYEATAPGTNSYYPDGIYLNCLYYCTNSLVFAKGITAFNSANNNSGIIYFNNYNNITVDNSVVNNNDWSSVYNSYVTNVNNTYNTEVTNNNGNDLTINELRQIMTTYLTPIYNAIEDGLTDIAEKVSYINEWLSKIYSNGSLIITRLDSIIQIIQQNTGGSGSTSGTACAWSDQEVDIVLDKLSRIYTEQVDNDLEVIAALEYIKTKISSLDTTLTTASSNISTISSNTSSIVTSLDTELSRLATVLTKMDTIISKMGQNRITRPTVDPNIIDDLEDLLPESVLDDIFSPFAALGSIIETVVPFCYIGVAVAIMSNLSAEAEAPYWEIPFKYDSDALALHIDEKIIIDLSPFEDLSTILRLLFIIAFTISLMFFSLPLVNYMTGIFSGR